MSISVEASRSIEAVAERWCVGLSRNGTSTRLVHLLRVTAVDEILQHFGATTDVGTIRLRDAMRFEVGRSELARYALREILRQRTREILRQRTPPRQRGPLRRMSSVEAARTIAALTPQHWRDLATLVVGTDLTVREALALEWDDVDHAAATVRVTRMASVPRTVHLTGRLVALIMSQPRTGRRIFPFCRSSATRVMRRAMASAGTGGPGRGWSALTRRTHAHNAMTILTAQDVSEIRKLLAGGDRTKADIGRTYGVSPTTIYDISRGRTWGGYSDK